MGPRQHSHRETQPGKTRQNTRTGFLGQSPKGTRRSVRQRHITTPMPCRWAPQVHGLLPNRRQARRSAFLLQGAWSEIMRRSFPTRAFPDTNATTAKEHIFPEAGCRQDGSAKRSLEDETWRTQRMRRKVALRFRGPGQSPVPPSAQPKGLFWR